MAGIEPAVDADGGTLSPNNKRPMINEAGKQTKMLHSLLIPESTPGPETARIEADKRRRQAELIRSSASSTLLTHPQDGLDMHKFSIKANKFECIIYVY